MCRLLHSPRSEDGNRRQRRVRCLAWPSHASRASLSTVPTLALSHRSTPRYWTGKAGISPDWAEVRADCGQCINFQQVQGYRPPVWPEQDVPQQMHLDVIVDDLDAGEAAVLDLGAIKHDYQPGETFRVFLDPAGHPFCLCVA